MTPLNILKESAHFKWYLHHSLHQINDAIINISDAFYPFSWLLTLHLWLLTLHGYSRYTFGTPAVPIWTHAQQFFAYFQAWVPWVPTKFLMASFKYKWIWSSKTFLSFRLLTLHCLLHSNITVPTHLCEWRGTFFSMITWNWSKINFRMQEINWLSFIYNLRDQINQKHIFLNYFS